MSASALLPSHLGKTVRYAGQRYTVECVRLTWRRVIPPQVELGLTPRVVTATSELGVHPCSSPRGADCLWVSDMDVIWEEES